MFSKKALTLLIILLLVPLSLASTNISETSANDSMPGSVDKPVIVFFHSPTCPHCEEVQDHINELDNSEYQLKKYEASQNTELFRDYIQNHSIPVRYAGSVPTVFIGEDSAVGSKNSINLIDNAIADPEKRTRNNSEQNDEEASNIGLIGLAALAVTDSINPCALAVLLVLMGSIISGNLEDRIRAIKSGASFVAGIFTSYFIMGLLLILGIKSVQNATSVSFSSIYIFFGVFAILIGAMNLKDWYSHGFGGFVMEVPFSWRPKMKSYLQKVTGPAGAFITAVIVSLFLLPCTSGPYFVAGGMLSEISLSSSIPLLGVYNLIFVLPMILIIAGIYIGFVEVEEVKDWRENNIQTLHLASGVIMISLGLFLLSQHML